MRHSLAVRRFTYRGDVGWKLSGSPAGSHHRLSMFFEHEAAARRTFRHFVDNPNYVTTTEDFNP